MTETPKFRRVASGDYETKNGRFRLYRLVDVYPPAWNVEDVSGDSEVLLVDGAATKRDALALFDAWHESVYRPEVRRAIRTFLAVAS